MPRLWRLKFQRWRISRHFDGERNKLLAKKSPREEVYKLDADEYYTLRAFDEEIERLNALDLWRKAIALDVETPSPSEDEMWIRSEDGKYTFLSIKGRALVREAIYEENARRLEFRSGYFTKIVLPLLTLVVAIIGSVTGLLAVLRHVK